MDIISLQNDINTTTKVLKHKSCEFNTRTVNSQSRTTELLTRQGNFSNSSGCSGTDGEISISIQVVQVQRQIFRRQAIFLCCKHNCNTVISSLSV